jgi:hypothetical protein
MFQIPSGEWRMAFSRTHQVGIAASLDDTSIGSATDLNDAFAGHTIDIHTHSNVTERLDASSIVKATLANDILNASSSYRDKKTDCLVKLEYPINVMNLNAADGEWQVCTGPVIVPDTGSWNGAQITKVYLAHIAISAFDHLELIFSRPVEVASEVTEWLDKPRGRDRLELRDPQTPPEGYPPKRPRPIVYHDVWELEADNVILTAKI